MSRRDVNSAAARRLDIAEEAINCCQKIETLAQLLAAVGEPGCSHAIDSEVAARTGWMISEEAQQLHGLLEVLEKKLVK